MQNVLLEHFQIHDVKICIIAKFTSFFNFIITATPDRCNQLCPDFLPDKHLSFNLLLKVVRLLSSFLDEIFCCLQI